MSDLEHRDELYYESMTKLQWGHWTIRVWMQLDDVGTDTPNWTIHNALARVDPLQAPNDILRVLVELDRVNAVEILDRDGNGTVVHNGWP